VAVVRQKVGTITDFNLEMYVDAFSIPGSGRQGNTSGAWGWSMSTGTQPILHKWEGDLSSRCD
jgi:hypothetical protein